MRECILQVSCFAGTHTLATSIARAARNALLFEDSVAESDLESAIRSRLLAASSVTDQLTNSDAQISWVKRNQGIGLPAIVLVKVGGDWTEDEDDLDLQSDASVDNFVFWRASSSEPRDLGAQEPTGFVHHEAVDMTMRYARAA